MNKPIPIQTFRDAVFHADDSGITFSIQHGSVWLETDKHSSHVRFAVTRFDACEGVDRGEFQDTQLANEIRARCTKP